MTTGIRCRLCGHADIRELDAGYMCLDHAACAGRRTTGANPEAAKCTMCEAPARGVIGLAHVCSEQCADDYVYRSGK